MVISSVNEAVSGEPCVFRRSEQKTNSEPKHFNVKAGQTDGGSLTHFSVTTFNVGVISPTTHSGSIKKGKSGEPF